MIVSPESYRKLRTSFDRGTKMRKRRLTRLFEQQKCLCAYCETQMEPISINQKCHKERIERPTTAPTLDHVKPLGLGGTNDPDNFVACCHGCNIKKANKLPLNFIWGDLLG